MRSPRGRSVEHWNAEAAASGCSACSSTSEIRWINPQPQSRWVHTASIEATRELLDGRMYPLTLAGLDDAMDALS